MKVKLIHELDESEADVLGRLVHTDDAFGLLWDLQQEISEYFNHGIHSKKNAEKILEKLNSEIGESRLLEYYK